MYSDIRSKKHIWLILLILFLLAAVTLSFFSGHDPWRDLSDESAAAIESAIKSCALQCYVVEGIYPPSLTYMEENYGLQVNHRDFYIDYEAFASNLPPAVKVVSKKSVEGDEGGVFFE